LDDGFYMSSSLRSPHLPADCALRALQVSRANITPAG
jgi:hypothetical protein